MQKYQRFKYRYLRYFENDNLWDKIDLLTQLTRQQEFSNKIRLHNFNGRTKRRIELNSQDPSDKPHEDFLDEHR